MDKKYNTIEDFLNLEEEYDVVYVERCHHGYIDSRTLKIKLYPYNMLYPKGKKKFTVGFHDYNHDTFEDLLLMGKLYLK